MQRAVRRVTLGGTLPLAGLSCDRLVRGPCAGFIRAEDVRTSRSDVSRPADLRPGCSSAVKWICGALHSVPGESWAAGGSGKYHPVPPLRSTEPLSAGETAAVPSSFRQPLRCSTRRSGGRLKGRHAAHLALCPEQMPPLRSPAGQ